MNHTPYHCHMLEIDLSESEVPHDCRNEHLPVSITFLSMLPPDLHIQHSKQLIV
jgi:hypothetical protein